MECRSFDLAFLDSLLEYLDGLSRETVSRFSPHPFTRSEITRLHQITDGYRLFIATLPSNGRVIAYTIVKLGWLGHDAHRLQQYGLLPETGDCTIAPSVADDWQGKGLGSLMFDFTMDQLRAENPVSRIILWGGVQADNSKAIGFYKKKGFRTLGQFMHYGENIDMMLVLP